MSRRNNSPEGNNVLRELTENKKTPRKKASKTKKEKLAEEYGIDGYIETTVCNYTRKDERYDNDL